MAVSLLPSVGDYREGGPLCQIGKRTELCATTQACLCYHTAGLAGNGYTDGH